MPLGIPIVKIFFMILPIGFNSEIFSILTGFLWLNTNAVITIPAVTRESNVAKATPNTPH